MIHKVFELEGVTYKASLLATEGPVQIFLPPISKCEKRMKPELIPQTNSPVKEIATANIDAAIEQFKTWKAEKRSIQ